MCVCVCVPCVYVCVQPLGEGMVLDILYQCADGLHHLHTLCIIHRDVRADNVLVAGRDPIWVLIADFGLAHKLQDAATGASASATVFGPIGSYCLRVCVCVCVIVHMRVCLLCMLVFVCMCVRAHSSRQVFTCVSRGSAWCVRFRLESTRDAG
jgi:serine/threonine protein kinase